MKKEQREAISKYLNDKWEVVVDSKDRILISTNKNIELLYTNLNLLKHYLNAYDLIIYLKKGNLYLDFYI